MIQLAMRDPSYSLTETPTVLLQKDEANSDAVVHRLPLTQKAVSPHVLQQVRSLGQATTTVVTAAPAPAPAPAPAVAAKTVVTAASASASAVGTKSAASAESAASASITAGSERVPMTTTNAFIYYAQIGVGSPSQNDIHVIVDTGSSVFAIFSVPHGGPSALQIILLIAAGALGFAAVTLLAISWWAPGGCARPLTAPGSSPRTTNPAMSRLGTRRGPPCETPHLSCSCV